MKFSASLLLSALATSAAFVAQPSPSVRLGSTEMYERKAFITGNWKLNPQTKDEAIELAKGIAGAVNDESPCDVALFVPFPYIESVQKTVGDKVIIGAEVCHLLVIIQVLLLLLHRRIYIRLCCSASYLMY